MALFDAFLKLDGIKGESADSKHKGEINVTSFSFGARQPASAAAGGQGQGVGKVQFQQFELQKYIDAASPLLMVACASGQHFKEAELVVRKAGGEQIEYLKIKLTDVLISSFKSISEYKPAGWELGEKPVEGEAILPVDSFALGFSKVEYVYKAQNPDGTAGANIQAGWDVKANKKV